MNLTKLLKALEAIFNRRPIPQQPSEPVSRTVTIRLFESDGVTPIASAAEHLDWEDGAHVRDSVSDPFGRAFYNVDAGANVSIVVTKDGYVTIPRLGLGVENDYTLTMAKSFTMTGESQALHRDGKVMRRADGTIFDYRATSRFALGQRFMLGQDVTGLIDEDVELGFNAQRVIAIFDGKGIGGATGLGECSPRVIPNFYKHVSDLTDLAATRGMFLAWCYCADCDSRDDGSGGLMTDRATVQAHIDAMDAALAGKWNVLRQGANEPFKNLKDVASYRFRRDIQPLDFGIETLTFGDTEIPHADWIGKHDHERKDDEFMRDPRSIDELREGFDWLDNNRNVVGHYNGSGTPVSADEPMGFAEVPQPGRRSSSPDDARALAALARAMGMGSCFHSDDGIAARPYRPVTKACAVEWLVGARFIPVEAQLAPYQRGGRGGGPGIGQMPIEHHDLDEAPIEPRSLRSFCKLVNGVEYCVRSRPIGKTVARDGWRIVDEPRLGLVKLTR